ncbi:hemerythrin domain-containing protein [Roseibium sediminicola]|uniref:Hemerythrin domain-containing protein n=1 Tax=Roseibium sediminicola TaxID=2933272 RepID=A0ABT0GMV1_9HYPH|nr:hemerythrin domain-containing protein [Roseibium sp. CAU 1639]MCK7610756.1 hemerythrin domain-containing protein [Roseibium sp. CAU 1639]
MNNGTDLDKRTGLPEEWLFLLKRHPRDDWADHRNLGPLTEFWLARHNGFRQLGQTLDTLLSDFREGRIDANRFGGLFAPRLQQFLSELHHHHQIEDHHYFPVFMAAEKRLVAGFELLEGDHELIHHRIETVVKSANKLFGQMGTRDRDAIRRAADNFAGVSDTLVSGLMRHLDDEEDLIVPLILERGERKLGLS